MYLVLLVFGALLAIAGLAIGSAGVSIHDRTFDASLLTPGVIAAVGGLIIMGLGRALRILQRIEAGLQGGLQAPLALRPMPRALRDVEAPVAMAPEAPTPPQRIPLPAKPDVRPDAAAAAPVPAEPKAIERAIDPARLKFPTLASIEGAGAVRDSDGASPPKAPRASTIRPANRTASGLPSIETAADQPISQPGLMSRRVHRRPRNAQRGRRSRRSGQKRRARHAPPNQHRRPFRRRP